eukprot:9997870-Ditylum_brightwellii.AAC.1
MTAVSEEEKEEEEEEEEEEEDREKSKTSDTDTDLITINDNDNHLDKNAANDNLDENAENEDRTQEHSNNGSYTLFDNGVDGSDTYQQFKELLCRNSLHDMNVCSLKLMELLFLGKLDKGATTPALKFMSRNKRWFNKKQKKPLK